MQKEARHLLVDERLMLVKLQDININVVLVSWFVMLARFVDYLEQPGYDFWKFSIIFERQPLISKRLFLISGWTVPLGASKVQQNISFSSRLDTSAETTLTWWTASRLDLFACPSATCQRLKTVGSSWTLLLSVLWRNQSRWTKWDYRS